MLPSAIKARYEKLRGRGSELPQRLAHSFGGDSSDLFIHNRMAALHLRVAFSAISSQPRRGFDALVETLSRLPDLRSLLAGSDERAAKALAALLGAAPADRVVHNLLLRLRRLLASG